MWIGAERHVEERQILKNKMDDIWYKGGKIQLQSSKTKKEVKNNMKKIWFVNLAVDIVKKENTKQSMLSATS